MVVHPINLIVIPLLMAFVSLFFKRHFSMFLAFLTSLFNLWLIYQMFPNVMQKSIIVKIGGVWSPPLSIVLVLSPLSLLLAGLIAFLSVLSSFYSLKYISKGDMTKYSALFLLFLTGSTGVVLTGDIFNLFVFFEILCVSSYILVFYYKNRESYEASFKYLIQGSIGSAFILMGIALIYQEFGTLNMADIAKNISFPLSFSLKLSLAFFITGFGVEAAIFPLNAWLPDAHPAAPASISALLSGIAIKTGIYAIFRIVYTVYGFNNVFKPLLFLGFITLSIGELSAFLQNDMKRLLAYSSIGQIGLIVIALSLGSIDAVQAGLFQIVNHAFSKGMLFLISGYYLYKYKTRSLSELEKIDTLDICIFIFMIIGVASLLGIPPFLGFFSKFSIFLALLQNSGVIYKLIAIGVAIMTAIEAAYFIRMLGKIAYTKGKIKMVLPAGFERVMVIPIFILSILIVIGGIYYSYYSDILNKAALGLINKQMYILQVLGGI